MREEKHEGRKDGKVWRINALGQRWEVRRWWVGGGEMEV